MRTIHSLFAVAFCIKVFSFKVIGRCHCFVRSYGLDLSFCKSGAGTLTGEEFGFLNRDTTYEFFSGFQSKALITRITMASETDS